MAYPLLGSTMFSRYDKDAKLAVYYAAALAAHRNLTEITPADLLLGLTWRQHAANCEFRHLKQDCEELWSSVGVAHLPLSAIPYQPAVPPLPLNHSAKQVLSYTANEADRSGDYWIDIDHMLLGLLRNGGMPAEALLKAGWTSERIKVAALQSRQNYPPKAIPWNARYQRFPWWSWVVIGVLLLGIVTLYLSS